MGDAGSVDPGGPDVMSVGCGGQTKDKAQSTRRFIDARDVTSRPANARTAWRQLGEGGDEGLGFSECVKVGG